MNTLVSRYKRAYYWALSTAVALCFVGCAEDTPPEVLSPAADIAEIADTSASSDSITVDGPISLKFGIDPVQNPSDAPFPNNLYLTENGVQVSRLTDDPVLSDMALEEVLAKWSDVMNQRTGFGSTSPVWFFTNGAVDEDSLAGRITMVSLDGRDAGREVVVQTWFDERWNVIGVYPAWGDFLEPNSTYAVIVRSGVTANGEGVAVPEQLAVALTSEPVPDGLDQLRDAYAPLRKYLADANIALDDVVGATVFTTQAVRSYGEAFFTAADDYALGAITRRVGWDEASGAFIVATDIEGAELAAYYGPMPTGEFKYSPGVWSGRRNDATYLPGNPEPYSDGNLHYKIGRVINGSIEAPALNYQKVDGAAQLSGAVISAGKATSEVVTLIPFTLILCEDHLVDPSNIPVALFSHGGGAQRTDVLPWANLGCTLNIATLSTDMPYHGGRRLQTWLADEKLLVPSAADTYNHYTGLSEGEPGFRRDYVGDPTSAAENVGPMYALNTLLDPDIVEANLMTYAADAYVTTRYIAEADWTGLVPGLSFDAKHIFHYSLSFGTTFTTPMHALRSPFKGVIGSVGTGTVLSVNLMNGPSNSVAAAGVLSIVLGLQSTGFDLSTTSLRDVALGFHQWLHERGDPMPYTPYVLRYREGARTPTLHSGNSWDETLFSPAQLSYQNSIGMPAYTAGAEWTLDKSVPGAENTVASEAPAELVNNAEFEGMATTAGIFYYGLDCHAQVVVPICTTEFEHPYPPVVRVENPTAKVSPICALHHQMRTFLSSLLTSEDAVIVPPGGDCESLYGAD